MNSPSTVFEMLQHLLDITEGRLREEYKYSSFKDNLARIQGEVDGSGMELKKIADQLRELADKIDDVALMLE